MRLAEQQQRSTEDEKRKKTQAVNQGQQAVRAQRSPGREKDRRDGA